MGNFKTSSLVVALASAVSVAAHGHIDWLVADGVAYPGYNSPSFTYTPNHPPVVGWTIDQPDNGFVEPKDFGGPDIICHKNASPAPGHVTVKAGAKIMLQWNTWPHKGPMINYLAKCPGNCETVDKTSLEFFKIDQIGLIDMTLTNGNWGADVMVANNFSWVIQIPPTLAAGNYVLRHETLALHSAGSPNGAQAYPQCFNLQVTGGGSLSPAGVKGVSLYKATDAGVLFNLYTSPLNYQIPGPTLVAGLPSSVAQVFTVATATSSVTLPGAGGNPTTPATTPTTRITTSTARATTPTTLVTSRTSTLQPTLPTTTSASSNGGVAQKYGQCGGLSWTGPTTCVAGSTCVKSNDHYSQCL